MLNKIERAGEAFLNSVGGRKFIVWVTATVLRCIDKLPPEQWVIISGVFMGLAIAERFFNKPGGNGQ